MYFDSRHIFLHRMSTDNLMSFMMTNDASLSNYIVQGQPTQTGFFELALRDRNMQVRVFWKVFLKS